jgi:hypothetical protein
MNTDSILPRGGDVDRRWAKLPRFHADFPLKRPKIAILRQSYSAPPGKFQAGRRVDCRIWSVESPEIASIRQIRIPGSVRHTGSYPILCRQTETTTMNPTNILPFLLFLLSGLPIALALAGLLIDECATLAAADAGATEPAVRRTAPPAAEPRLSPARASATVAASRTRVSSAAGTRYFPQAAQPNLATAT